MHELDLVRAPEVLAPAALTRTLLESVLDGRPANTVRSYDGDYRDYARWVSSLGSFGPLTPATALEGLVSLDSGSAHAFVIQYRAHLVARKLAPATIARRLAALRTAVLLAKQIGRCAWTLEVDAPGQEAYRDTSGPGLEGWKKILALAEAEAPTSPKGRRDLAIVRLLHDLALRRGEAISLDLAHVSGGTLEVKGKGRHHRVRLTLSRAARKAVEAWVSVRGDWPGPLFVGLTTGRLGPSVPRLTGEGIRLVVGSLARRAGVPEPVRPHGLRHQAITEALDATNGDVRKVAKFSRHKRIETVIRYDDNRADVAGEIAELLGGP